MAKHGLRKIWILKDQIGLIWGKPYGRRREKEERKKKKRKRKKREEPRSSKAKLQRGMELLTLYMNSIMNHMDFVWDSREGYEFQI